MHGSNLTVTANIKLTRPSRTFSELLTLCTRFLISALNTSSSLFSNSEEEVQKVHRGSRRQIGHSVQQPSMLGTCIRTANEIFRHLTDKMAINASLVVRINLFWSYSNSWQAES